MAKRHCTQMGRGKGGKKVCRKFSGGTSGLSGASAGKGRCKVWSKGRTKCLKRA